MKSILIVEDDITYGIMLKTWLTKKGYQIHTASNVARARKVIETETVDLILSDLRLPDHDGIDILRWLIKHERMIPLIIMTGYADIQSAVQAMKLGASDYVPKPINPDELLKKIEDALKKSEEGDPAFAPKRKNGAGQTSTASPSDFLGICGSPHPPAQQASRQAFHCHRLRRHPQGTGRFRVLRACERGFYRCLE